MKVTADTKIRQLIQDYPQIQELIKQRFSFFYEERIEDIALKRLSIKGAFNVLGANSEEVENFVNEINLILNNTDRGVNDDKGT